MLAIGRALMCVAEADRCSTSRRSGWRRCSSSRSATSSWTSTQQGTSVLLIEQNAMMALSIAHYGYIMETGKVVMDGDPREAPRRRRRPGVLPRPPRRRGREALVPGHQALQAPQALVLMAGESAPVARGRRDQAAVRRRDRRSTTSASTSARPSCSPSSAPTAPARRRSSTRSARCTGRRRGDIRWKGE